MTTVELLTSLDVVNGGDGSPSVVSAGGTWTLIMFPVGYTGATTFVGDNPTVDFQGEVPGNYVFQYTVGVGACQETANLTVEVLETPVPSISGDTICSTCGTVPTGIYTFMSDLTNASDGNPFSFTFGVTTYTPANMLYEWKVNGTTESTGVGQTTFAYDFDGLPQGIYTIELIVSYPTPIGTSMQTCPNDDIASVTLNVYCAGDGTDGWICIDQPVNLFDFLANETAGGMFTYTLNGGSSMTIADPTNFNPSGLVVGDMLTVTYEVGVVPCVDTENFDIDTQEVTITTTGGNCTYELFVRNPNTNVIQQGALTLTANDFGYELEYEKVVTDTCSIPSEIVNETKTVVQDQIFFFWDMDFSPGGYIDYFYLHDNATGTQFQVDLSPDPTYSSTPIVFAVDIINAIVAEMTALGYTNNVDYEFQVQLTVISGSDINIKVRFRCKNVGVGTTWAGIDKNATFPFAAIRYSENGGSLVFKNFDTEDYNMTFQETYMTPCGQLTRNYELPIDVNGATNTDINYNDLQIVNSTPTIQLNAGGVGTLMCTLPLELFAAINPVCTGSTSYEWRKDGILVGTSQSFVTTGAGTYEAKVICSDRECTEEYII